MSPECIWGAGCFDFGSMEFLFDRRGFFCSLVPWLPMGFRCLHDLPGYEIRSTPCEAICGNTRENSWRYSKIIVRWQPGNLVFSNSLHLWSCIEGHERDWHLSHGEDWTAGALSSCLHRIIDATDDNDSGDAHVGVLVSGEGERKGFFEEEANVWTSALLGEVMARILLVLLLQLCNIHCMDSNRCG